MQQEDLKRMEHEAILRLQEAAHLQDIAQIRSEILGKKGSLGAVLRGIGHLPPAERRSVGQSIHDVKARLERAFQQAEERLAAHAAQQELEKGRCDVTLPGRRPATAAAHPLRLMERLVADRLRTLGFSPVSGPLVEHEWYNFEGLNMPAGHPARDMQDTFFLAPQVLLRTHTSNVQIRTMLQRQPPVRIFSSGMVFRRDTVDATHSPMFHQLEGLWVDGQASFADLKGVLRALMGHLFGPHTQVRFRPSYFPFTEPSTEVDIRCLACQVVSLHGQEQKQEQGCRLCKSKGWLEVLGAGMVNPQVLEAVGYAPDKVQGFAFGLGLDRLALLRFGIPDIRLLYENDLRFLTQFSGARD